MLFHPTSINGANGGLYLSYFVALGPNIIKQNMFYELLKGPPNCISIVLTLGTVYTYCVATISSPIATGSGDEERRKTIESKMSQKRSKLTSK